MAEIGPMSCAEIGPISVPRWTKSGRDRTNIFWLSGYAVLHIHIGAASPFFNKMAT